MQTEVIMSGFGGQGLMMIGKLLAYAGLEEGKEVTWLPSYGPEMRGGTANCTVVIGDQPIGSPLISSPKAAVVMNQPSLEKFAPMLRKDGILVINSTMVPVRYSLVSDSGQRPRRRTRQPALGQPGHARGLHRTRRGGLPRNARQGDREYLRL